MTKNILDLNCGFLGYYYIYHQQHYQIPGRCNMFFQFSKKKVCCPISMVITYTTILEICIQDKLFLSLVYEFYNFFLVLVKYKILYSFYTTYQVSPFSIFFRQLFYTSFLSVSVCLGRTLVGCILAFWTFTERT